MSQGTTAGVVVGCVLLLLALMALLFYRSGGRTKTAFERWVDHYQTSASGVGGAGGLRESASVDSTAIYGHRKSFAAVEEYGGGQGGRGLVAGPGAPRASLRVPQHGGGGGDFLPYVSTGPGRPSLAGRPSVAGRPSLAAGRHSMARGSVSMQPPIYPPLGHDRRGGGHQHQVESL